jgi:hypothetical protein
MNQKISPREYALKHGLSLQAVYLRIWLKKVEASKEGRRWLISDEPEAGKGRQCTN